MKHALIIDDSDFIRKTIALILRKRGFASFETAGGGEALELLRGFRPDFILCDYNMPEIDGLSFLKRLRDSSDYVHTPVIIISTSRNAECMAEARSRGATWLPKPFRTPQLLAAIETAAAAPAASVST